MIWTLSIQYLIHGSINTCEIISGYKFGIFKKFLAPLCPSYYVAKADDASYYWICTENVQEKISSNKKEPFMAGFRTINTCENISGYKFSIFKKFLALLCPSYYVAKVDDASYYWICTENVQERISSNRKEPFMAGFRT